MYQRIEKKITQRIIIKILLSFFLAALIIALLIISFPFCNGPERIFSVILSIALYAFLFCKVKLIPLLRDTAWFGIMESRACNKKLIPKGPVRPILEEYMYAYWKIRKDDDEEVVLSYDTEDIADDYFHTGDRVYHYKGAKFIILAAPEADNDNLLCPLCGKLVMKPECSFCKIDFDTAHLPTAKKSQPDTDF